MTTTTSTQLVESYYAMFDRDRQTLNPYYRSWSILSWNGGANIETKAGIMQRLQGLPYNNVRHVVNSLNAGPPLDNGSLHVLVSGSLFINDNPNPNPFTETFIFAKEGDAYYIQNQSFRFM